MFQIGILLCYKCPLHKQKIDHEDKENTVENHSIMVTHKVPMMIIKNIKKCGFQKELICIEFLGAISNLIKKHLRKLTKLSIFKTISRLKSLRKAIFRYTLMLMVIPSQ